MLIVLDNCEHRARCRRRAGGEPVAGRTWNSSAGNQPAAVTGRRRIPLSSGRAGGAAAHRQTIDIRSARLFGGRAFCRASRRIAGFVRTHRRERAHRHRYLSPPGRHPARHRARRGAGGSFPASRGWRRASTIVFSVLTKGRRTALPRHQTLRATLDWSFELLSDPEKIVLRRLAMMVGEFTMEAAIALASGTERAAVNAVDTITGLIEKSLVATDLSGNVVHYRLLGTTRAYALEKLKASGEADSIARCHAAYFRELARQAEADWETPARRAVASDLRPRHRRHCGRRSIGHCPKAASFPSGSISRSRPRRCGFNFR